MAKIIVEPLEGMTQTTLTVALWISSVAMVTEGTVVTVVVVLVVEINCLKSSLAKLTG